jgi:hypothetical protein
LVYGNIFRLVVPILLEMIKPPIHSKDPYALDDDEFAIWNAVRTGEQESPESRIAFIEAIALTDLPLTPGAQFLRFQRATGTRAGGSTLWSSHHRSFACAGLRGGKARPEAFAGERNLRADLVQRLAIPAHSHDHTNTKHALTCVGLTGLRPLDPQ